MSRIKLAMNWAGACGGCDVSLLDTEDKLLELADRADVVYWPVAVDHKRRDLQGQPDGSVDVGLFNGVVRTSEQAEDAALMRRKCRILVSYGSCACFGGIPGLANLSVREDLLSLVYRDTPSTVNDGDRRPSPRVETEWGVLTLPELEESVRALHQLVQADYYLPGCPPSEERILDAVGLIAAVAEGGETPPLGTVLAPDHALCLDCERRESKTAERIARVVRPHEIMADQGTCFLEQGIVCMGPFTRSGCGGSCIKANQPCRGCFGPTPAQLDPGAEALSAFGSVVGPRGEDFLMRAEMKREVARLPDPAGTFYRFTLPGSVLYRRFTPAGRGRN